MTTVRLVLIGGFLGAGKTTVIGRLARAYADRGASVAIVTNDQAADLVDTHNFRAQGFAVAEVPGSCFCCAFDQLSDALANLTAQQRPDVLLAEPVGSCTDLVATVIEPVRKFYPDRYVVNPLVVLVDPVRAQKILSRAVKGGFSPKAAYIYEKQLQEADVIAVNKIDTLSESRRRAFLETIHAKFPDASPLLISGRTGEGLEHLQQLIEPQRQGKTIPEVDYDIYADGEAELGWLNGSFTLSAAQAFSIDHLLLQLLEAIQTRFVHADAEVAHLKIVIESEGKQAIGNLVRSDSPAELSRTSGLHTQQAELIVNARVFLDPEQLNSAVRAALADVCGQGGVQCQPQGSQHFRPSRPVPTHRFSSPV